MSFRIVSDSACDLRAEFVNNHGVKLVPFRVCFPGEPDFLDDGNLDFSAFYHRLEAPAYPKTSLPSVQEYMDVFHEAAEAGEELLCICLSSKLSGSYQAAVLAAQMVQEELPCSIRVIDSRVATMLQGLLVIQALALREQGKGMDETADILEQLKEDAGIFFTISGLDHLREGGRIGKAAAVLGDKLRLKPLISVENGEVGAAGVAMSRKKAMDKIVELIAKQFGEGKRKPEQYYFAVARGTDDEEAIALGHALEQKLGIRLSVAPAHIGPTIGAHTGPHPVGAGFLRRYAGD